LTSDEIGSNTVWFGDSISYTTEPVTSVSVSIGDIVVFEPSNLPMKESSSLIPYKQQATTYTLVPGSGYTTTTLEASTEEGTLGSHDYTPPSDGWVCLECLAADNSGIFSGVRLENTINLMESSSFTYEGGGTARYYTSLAVAKGQIVRCSYSPLKEATLRFVAAAR